MPPNSTIKYLFRECLATAVVLSVNFHWGLCQGYTIMLLPQLASNGSEIRIQNSNEESWVGSVFFLANPPGALVVGLLMDWLGRRVALRISYSIFVVGWLTNYWARTLTAVFAGQLMLGLSAGMEPVSPVYIAETSSTANRATKLTLTSVAVTVGIFISNLIVHMLQWKRAALALAGFSTLSATLTFLIPESPDWLRSKNRISAADASMRWFGRERHTADLETRGGVESARKGDQPEDGQLKHVTRAWKPFCILQLFFILQLLSGYSICTTYTVGLFELIGTPVSVITATIAYTVLLAVFSVVIAVFIDRYDRRTWCVVSAGGLCACYSVAAVYTRWFGGTQVTWIPTGCMWASIAFGMLGVNSLPWLVASELLPLHGRGFMTGLLYVTVYSYIFVANKIYPLIVPTVHVYSVLATFAVAAFGAVLFGQFFLPETRGKSLAQIEKLWTKSDDDNNEQGGVLLS